MEDTPPPRRLAPVLLLGLAAFLSQFDVTALAVALPTIGASLGLGPAGSAWVVDSYSLAFATALLPAGYVADTNGRRRVLLVGLVAFAVASAGCALATTGPALWAWRAGQGVGAALVTCAALALLAGIHGRHEDRVWAFGWVGTIVGLAMIVGPAGGGVLASWFGWEAIFWVNPPICLALLVAGRFGLGEQRGRSGSRAGLAAILAGVLAVAAVVWSLLEGDHRGWGSAAVAAPAAASAALLIALATRLPRIDAAGHVRPGFFAVCALAALLSVAYWATLVVLPLACARWFAIEPAHVGVLMLAATLPMLALPRLGARLARDRGLATLFALGFGLVAAGDLLLWRAATAPTLPAMVAGMLLAGGGAGLVNAQLSGAFVGLAMPQWAGMASALGITMRQLGFALGVALLGALAGATAAPFAGSFAVAASAAGVGALLALRLPARVHDGQRVPRGLAWRVGGASRGSSGQK